MQALLGKYTFLMYTKVNSLKQLDTCMVVQDEYCTILEAYHSYVLSSQICMFINYLMEKLLFLCTQVHRGLERSGISEVRETIILK